MRFTSWKTPYAWMWLPQQFKWNRHHRELRWAWGRKGYAIRLGD